MAEKILALSFDRDDPCPFDAIDTRLHSHLDENGRVVIRLSSTFDMRVIEAWAKRMVESKRAVAIDLPKDPSP